MNNEQSKNLQMKMDYDIKNDSLFMYRKDKTNYQESIEVREGLILDFNEDMEPMSFEILNISKILGVKKFSVQHLLEIKGVIGINKDSIALKLAFIIPIHQKNVEMPILLKAPNDINLPHIKANLIGLSTA